MEDLRDICTKNGYEFVTSDSVSVHFKHLGFLFKCRLATFPPKQLKTNNLVDRSDENAFIFKKLEIIHNNRYSYENSVYAGCNGSFDVLCSRHGVFSTTYTNHLQGKGCRACGIEGNISKFTFTLNDFIVFSEKVHRKRYDYSGVVYEKNNVKVDIRCRTHGVFQQTPAAHWQGNGCPRCGDHSATLKKIETGFCGYSRGSYCKQIKVSSVYLMRLRKEDETIYKIGLSNKVRRRLMDISSETNYQVSCVFFKQLDSEAAYDAEKFLQKHFKKLKVIPTEPFKGFTECFKEIPIQEFVRLLNTFLILGDINV